MSTNDLTPLAPLPPSDTSHTAPPTQAPAFKPAEVLCQLFKLKPTLELAFGLPLWVPPLDAESMKKPVLVDNATRERFEMMEINDTKLYHFVIGEEIRIRLKNNTAPPKAFYFCVLFQDHSGAYQSIFPNSSPQVRSVHTDFKCLHFGQETVLSIPTGKLPKANEFLAGADATATVRMILVSTVTDKIRDVVTALKKRMEMLQTSSWQKQEDSNDGLVVFNYKFTMCKKEVASTGTI